MKTVTLTFDILESKKMNGDQLSELRQEMSLQLDRDLREAGVGKCSGGLQSMGRIQVFLTVNSCQEALPIVRGILKDHWLLPSMKVKRQK